MKSEQIIAWIGVALGIYGALLSTFNYLSQRHEKKKSLKIDASYFMGDNFIPWMRVVIVNNSRRRITLDRFGVMLPHGKLVRFHVQHLKYPSLELEEGKKIEGVRSLEDLFKDGLKDSSMNGKQEIKPFAIDTVGKYYYGDIIVYDGIAVMERLQDDD